MTELVRSFSAALGNRFSTGGVPTGRFIAPSRRPSGMAMMPSRLRQSAWLRRAGAAGSACLQAHRLANFVDGSDKPLARSEWNDEVGVSCGDFGGGGPELPDLVERLACMGSCPRVSATHPATASGHWIECSMRRCGATTHLPGHAAGAAPHVKHFALDGRVGHGLAVVVARRAARVGLGVRRHTGHRELDGVFPQIAGFGIRLDQRAAGRKQAQQQHAPNGSVSGTGLIKHGVLACLCVARTVEMAPPHHIGHRSHPRRATPGWVVLPRAALR